MDSNSRNELWTRRNVLRAMGGFATLIATGALAACGGVAAKEPSVKMTDEMTFEPASLTIKVGDTVTWNNAGDTAMVHSATADPTRVQDPALVELPPGALPWDSGNLGRGQSWSYTFQAPGRYRYVCVPHQIAGMVGEIIVES